MKKIYLSMILWIVALIFNCFYLSTLYASTDVHDRFGIVTITIPREWSDDTEQYLKVVERLRLGSRTPPDTGIKSLIHVNSSNASCTFRELRYVANETGYRWGLEQLATNTSLVEKHVADSYTTTDYLRKGVPVSVHQKFADSTELISSKKIKLDIYDAWERVYKRSFVKAPSPKRTALAITYVIGPTSQAIANDPKYYIVAECGAESGDKMTQMHMTNLRTGMIRQKTIATVNQETLLREKQQEILSILNTIRITPSGSTRNDTKAIPGTIVTAKASDTTDGKDSCSMCSGYGDTIIQRKLDGEKVHVFFTQSVHGPPHGFSADSIPNLLDADYTLVNERSDLVRKPTHDISKLYSVTPLGNWLLREFEREKVVGESTEPTNVYGLPDNALERVREGKFSLDRFSRTIDGTVKPFNILMVRTAGDPVAVENLDAGLRAMRARVNLTDEEMAHYGVQFALSHGNGCRTLSYAADTGGRIGMVYTNSMGNFNSDSMNSSLVVSHGETAQRTIWHKLMGNKKGDLKFHIRPDLENVGLVSVLEQDMTIIFRTSDFTLINLTFKKTGPNTMTFGQVARECTRMGLEKYDEYQKRTDGVYPTIENYVRGCLENSNFTVYGTRLIPPIRSRLMLQTDKERKEFYIRKFTLGAAKGAFQRYRTSELYKETSDCIKSGKNTIKGTVECLTNKNFQVIAVDTIKARELFLPGSKEEAEALAKSAAQIEAIDLRSHFEELYPKPRVKTFRQKDGTLRIVEETNGVTIEKEPPAPNLKDGFTLRGKKSSREAAP